MNVWKIGSRWSDNGDEWSSILDVFYNTKTVFAGRYKEYFLNQVKIGDLFCVTSGEKIVAVARAISNPTVIDKLEGLTADDFYSTYYSDFDYEYEYHHAVGCKVEIHTLRDEDVLPIHRGKTFCRANVVWNETIRLYEKYNNELKGIGMIESIKDLLEKSHNLILTGAPGTGKTFIAKQVASLMTKAGNENKNPIEMLEEALKSYKVDTEQQKKDKELIQRFTTLYPKENLEKLTLERYCIGTGTNNSFCWWIERGLASLSRYSPGSSKTYQIWFNKDSDSYLYSSYIKQKSIMEPSLTSEELMKILATDLHKIINDNEQKFDNLQFGKSFILKILSTYYPDIYFPINSEKHIDNLIKIFALDDCVDKNIFEKNKTLYKFYKEKTDGKISTYDFMRIVYNIFDLNAEVTQSNSLALEGDVSFVQFHPSYDYTDFIEGLRPTSPDENGVVGFEKIDGVFKKFCLKALDNPSKKYVFIIDEINRGEISKIFGELFYSIDPGDRVTQDMLKDHQNGTKKLTAIRTQYANMDKEPNGFDLALNENSVFGHFFIPDNVYILGTMNDIDRSVESMDFAFRRRFTWKEILASDTQKMIIHNPSAWSGVVIKETILKEIDERIKRLNEAIWNDSTETGIEGLSTAYHIGASYFLKLSLYLDDEESAFIKLWTNHLQSLLKEYLRGTGHEKDIKILENAYFNDNRDELELNNDDEPEESEVE